MTKSRYCAHFTHQQQYYRCGPNRCCHLDVVVVLFIQVYSTFPILCLFSISRPYDHTSSIFPHTSAVSHFIDISIRIHKSIHCRFSTLYQHITPHFTKYNDAHFFQPRPSTELSATISGQRAIICELSPYFECCPCCPCCPRFLAVHHYVTSHYSSRSSSLS